MKTPQAYAGFSRFPRAWNDIKKLSAVDKLKPFRIAKTIVLRKLDYINFITDLTVERLYLKEHQSLCKIDESGVWHCLLVVCQSCRGGVLVMVDHEGFPEYAAWFRQKNTARSFSMCDSASEHLRLLNCK